MRRGTRVFLLLGCAVVLSLEAPSAARGLAASARGPYGGGADARSAALGASTTARSAVDLARGAPPTSRVIPAPRPIPAARTVSDRRR